MHSVEEKSSSLHLWLIATMSVLAAAVLFWFDPSRFHFYPLCLFHSVTGLLCPGCGSLRALHQLFHGHVVAAFHLNPLLFICLPFFLWNGVARLVRHVTGQPRARSLRAVWFWLFLGSALMFGVLRNLPGEPFAFLRP
ncbi:MAG TPA: DUF2752 domain-containing protein [Candidatus Acidoferrum sp.]|jgi:hypothetical protein|nr:DUF2752 domain-containing protein [Candidatus Acidoferrum sp.]